MRGFLYINGRVQPEVTAAGIGGGGPSTGLFDWRESVLDKDLAAPPGAPSADDRYIVASPAAGAWAGHDDEIAQWTGSAWNFETPDPGFAAYVEDEDVVYTYNGVSWITIGHATTAPLDIYVDGDAGNDLNPGTQTSPVKTRAGAFALFPTHVHHPVKIHYNKRAGGAKYAVGDTPVHVLSDALIEYADDVWDPTVYTTLATGTTAAGTTQKLIVDSVGGMAVNAHRARTIEFTSGAAAGQRRLVRNNTATDIIPIARFNPAPGVGDSYRIFENAVEFDLESLGGNNTFKLGTNLSQPAAPVLADIASVVAAHILVGISFSNTTANRRMVTNGTFAFYGCQFGSLLIAYAGMTWYGVDAVAAMGSQQGTARAPFLYLGAPSDKAWVGWGLRVTAGHQPQAIPLLYGYVASSSVAATSVGANADGRATFIGLSARGISLGNGASLSVNVTADSGAEVEALAEDDGLSIAGFSIVAVSRPTHATLWGVVFSKTGAGQVINISGPGAVLGITGSRVTGTSLPGTDSVVVTEGARFYNFIGSDPVIGDATARDWRVGHVGPIGEGGSLRFNKSFIQTVKSVMAPDGSIVISGQNRDNAVGPGKDFSISPPQITANQNDYAPTDIQLAGVVRITSDAARDITGIEARSSGVDRHAILNVGSFAITLKNQDALSVEANRFALGADLVLNPDESVTLWYDPVSDRWR